MKTTKKLPLFASSFLSNTSPGYESHITMSRCARLLHILALAVLLVSCVSMAVVIKGAQHANHELQLQLHAEQMRMNRLKQSVAEEKVVIVEAEEKAKRLDKELAVCRFELEDATRDADDTSKELQGTIAELEESLKECTGRVKGAVDRIDTLLAANTDDVTLSK
jgi:SMC interacting uncharacterized protein involved in chromosome segregation